MSESSPGSYPARTTDASAPVQVWRDQGVAHIRFNRPRALNAIDAALAQALLAACRQVVADPQARVILLSGEGRAFMAGGDLVAIQADPVAVTDTLIKAMHEAIKLLDAAPQPIIAAVHGAVAGGGLGVAMCSDLMLAAEGTQFNLAYTRLGTSSDCSTSWGLPRLVGYRKAMEMALLCDSIDAREALALGLVNRVLPADELMPAALQWAARLESSAPMALARLKQLMRASLHSDLHSQLRAEEKAFQECARSADFAEGVAAFVGKRPARFSGR